jgi:hypothetical protein
MVQFPFSNYGILKVGVLYWEQLRIHAWKFHNDRIPDSQAAMLARVGDTYSYGILAHNQQPTTYFFCLFKILSQTISKWHPDEDKVLEIKQE